MTQLKIVKNLRRELDRLLDCEKSVVASHRAVEEKERQIEKWREERRLLETETNAIEKALQKKVSQLNKEKEKLVTEITTIHAMRGIGGKYKSTA